MGIAGEVKTKFQEASDARQNQETIWETAYWNTLGKFSPGVQKTLTTKSGEESSDLFIRIIPRNYRVLMAKMGSVIDSLELQATIRDADKERYENEPGIKQATYDRQNKFKKWLDMGGFKEEARKIVSSSIWSGNGIVRCPVVKEAIEVEYEPVGEDFPNVMTPKTERESYPAAKFVSIWDFYIEPTATCVKDAAYVIEVHKIQPCYLRQTAKELGWDSKVVDKILSEKIYGNSFGDDTETITQNAKTGQGEPSDDTRVWCYDYWGGIQVSQLKELDAEIDLSAAGDVSDDDYVEVNVVCCGDDVLKVALNPLYPYPEKPYYSLVWDVNPESPWGAGMPEGIKDQQELINGCTKLYTQSKPYSSVPMFEVDKEVIEPGQDYDFFPGKKWVKRPGYGDRAVLRPVVIPDVSDNILPAIQLFTSMGEDVSGVSRMSQGTGAPTNVTTATGQSILQANANEIDAERAKRIDDMFAFVLKMFDRYYMEMYETEDEKVPLNISVSAVRSAQAKELESQKILNMMQVLPMFTQAFPDIMPRLDIVALLTKYAENLEMPNFVRSEEELAKQSEQNIPPEVVAEALDSISTDPAAVEELYSKLGGLGGVEGIPSRTPGAGTAGNRRLQ